MQTQLTKTLKNLGESKCQNPQEESLLHCFSLDEFIKTVWNHADFTLFINLFVFHFTFKLTTESFLSDVKNTTRGYLCHLSEKVRVSFLKVWNRWFWARLIHPVYCSNNDKRQIGWTLDYYKEKTVFSKVCFLKLFVFDTWNIKYLTNLLYFQHCCKIFAHFNCWNCIQ